MLKTLLSRGFENFAVPKWGEIRYIIEKGGPVNTPSKIAQYKLLATSLRYSLLSLIAISGELPFHEVDRLPCGKRYKREIIHELLGDKLIISYCRDNLHVYRLTRRARDLLLDTAPARFSFFLTGSIETNRLKSEPDRRERLHRIAEAYVTMTISGVSIYRDHKPDVFAPMMERPLTIERPLFYASREIKSLGPAAQKIRSSRAIGALLTPTRYYAVYNTGSRLMRWSKRSELTAKTFLKSILCFDRRTSQYRVQEPQAILLGTGMDVARLLLEDGARNCFPADGTYDHFYFAPNDAHGEAVLQLLCSNSQRAALNELLARGLASASRSCFAENDALLEDGTPVLFAYDFDIPRIMRFVASIKRFQKKGRVICFDFQAEALREFCGELITFEEIKFEKYKMFF